MGARRRGLAAAVPPGHARRLTGLLWLNQPVPPGSTDTVLQRPAFLRGAFVASIFVGLVDTFGKAYFPDAALFVIYLLMVVVLLTRPQGLFGVGKA